MNSACVTHQFRSVNKSVEKVDVDGSGEWSISIGLTPEQEMKNEERRRMRAAHRTGKDKDKVVTMIQKDNGYIDLTLDSD